MGLMITHDAMPAPLHRLCYKHGLVEPVLSPGRLAQHSLTDEPLAASEPSRGAGATVDAARSDLPRGMRLAFFGAHELPDCFLSCECVLLLLYYRGPCTTRDLI